MRCSPFRAAVPLRVSVAIVVCAVADGTLAQNQNVTGRWSGSYAERVTCRGQTYTNNGSIHVIVDQSGSEVVGIVKIDDVARNAQCQIEDRVVLPLPGSGTISGSALVLNVQGPWGGSAITGTVSGTTLSLKSGGSFDATLTRTSSSPPDMRFNGTYSGSYFATLRVCGGPQTATSSGPVTLTIVQADGDGGGFVTTSNTKKDKCAYQGNPPKLVSASVVNVGTESRYFAAQIGGNTLNGFILYNQNDDDHLEDDPFTATLNASTVTGSGELLSFEATRRSSALSPVILRFGAESQTIDPGESVQLEWSVFNATSVNIDNGVGNQPPVGSVTLRPATTTTYRLTAIGPNDTMTIDSVTFTVANGPRRRAVRH